MLSRLPISLAQLKTGNNSQNYMFCTVQKKLIKQLYKSLVDMFKNGNNLYEH